MEIKEWARFAITLNPASLTPTDVQLDPLILLATGTVLAETPCIAGDSASSEANSDATRAAIGYAAASMFVVSPVGRATASAVREVKIGPITKKIDSSSASPESVSADLKAASDAWRSLIPCVIVGRQPKNPPTKVTLFGVAGRRRGLDRMCR